MDMAESIPPHSSIELMGEARNLTNPYDEILKISNISYEEILRSLVDYLLVMK